MTKEDKQIINKATKENWRIGDRTRLKRLLEKNLELYRENEELKKACDETQELLDRQIEAAYKLYKECKELEEKYNRVDAIGYDALKNLTEAKERIRALLFHLTNDTFYVTFETQEQSVGKARQFLGGGIKENE